MLPVKVKVTVGDDTFATALDGEILVIVEFVEGAVTVTFPLPYVDAKFTVMLIVVGKSLKTVTALGVGIVHGGDTGSAAGFWPFRGKLYTLPTGPVVAVPEKVAAVAVSASVTVNVTGDEVCPLLSVIGCAVSVVNVCDGVVVTVGLTVTVPANPVAAVTVTE